MTDHTAGTLQQWLRAASAGDATREAAIDAGAEELAKSTTAELLDLVLLAFGGRQEVAAGRVRDVVQARDETFRGRVSDRQTQIAAGWAIAQAIESEDLNPAVTAALAVQSAVFLTFETAAKTLPAIAARELLERADAARSRRRLPRFSSPKSLDELEIVATAAASSDQLTAVVDAANKVASALTSAQSGLATAVEQRLRASDEELDLLWWTISGRRNADGARWADFGDAAPVFVGIDAADMTQFVPPIASMNELIERVVAGLPALTLQVAVPAAAKAIESPAKAEHVLLPIHTAIGLYHADSSDWEAAARKLGLELSQSRTSAEIAEQTLREAIIIQQL